MTTPDALGPIAPADLVRQLSAVAEQFGSLLAELRLHSDERGATPEQTALHRLLSGEATADEGIAAGLSFAGARVVVALVPDSRHALRLVGQLRADKDAVAIWQPPDRLIVLVRGVPQRAGDDRGRRAASRVAALVLREAGAAIGVSSTLATAAQLQSAYREAIEAAAVAGHDAPEVVFADESWARVAMQSIVRHAVRSLPIDNPLARLRDYDAGHGTDLVRTVRTWLANNADTSVTATALSLHPNSLRYRIKRAQEIGRIDLDDADVRALAHVVWSRLEQG